MSRRFLPFRIADPKRQQSEYCSPRGILMKSGVGTRRRPIDSSLWRARPVILREQTLGGGRLQIVLVAGLVVVTGTGLLIYLLVSNVDSLPQSFLRILGYFLIGVSTIEALFIVWVLAYIWSSDQVSWGLSFDAFWREQLSAIYFIKEWFYSWLWNDLLILLLVYLPALLFLSIRTTITSVVGIWALAASKR